MTDHRPHTMTKLFSTKGFILGKRDFREADRIYTFFSEDLGKVDILVRGARRMSSKLAPHMETTSCVKAFLVNGRAGLTLAGVDIDKVFFLNDWKIPLYIASSQLVSLGTRWNHTESDLFNRFFEWTEFISEVQGLSDLRQKLVLGSFALRVVSHCGYMPELFYCLTCRKKITPDAFLWSSAKGGVVCKECSRQQEEVWLKTNKLDPRVLKLLRLAQNGSWDDLTKVEMINTVLEDFLAVVDSLILAHFPVIPSVSVAHMLQVDEWGTF